ncbi:DNA polymerase III subunit alpha [Candidatus Woesebacteria bacterium]|nr:DNA polymerase III subunit alpha [Candidatus Woesebacteria bacterium]
MSFIHLHVHSEYSLLDGLSRIDELIEKAKEHNMDSVALTDHGAMYGAFRFYIAARKAGIKPIIGMETYKAPGSRFEHSSEEGERNSYHLTLLAKNYAGYKNLMKLTTYAHLEGYYYKPRVDFELLEKYSEGIIAFSGCMSGEIAVAIRNNQKEKAENLLQQYHKIFKENYYIELQRAPGMHDQEELNTELVALSRKYNIPLVATNDVHYVNKEDAYAQDVLLCIQTGHTVYEENRPLSNIDTPEFYFKSSEEMEDLFRDLPEAIENTQKIADQCDLEIPYGKLILPIYPLKEGQTAEEQLRELTYAKAKERIALTQEEKTRLAYELDIICDKGYATYFLIVQDFINWSKSNNIGVGPGRGSVAGSLVAYSLKITDIHPLEYDVPFERFLNPDRPSPPDIDVDFADIHRDRVLEYVTEKYGKEKVAQIITFGRMEAKMAIRDVARALGMSYSHGDRISKMIPVGKQGFHINIDQAMQENPQLRMAYNEEEEVRKVLDVAKRLEGIARHSSVHAAGVMIADKDLTEYVPLQQEARGGKIVTQFDMYCLDLNAVSNNEAVGLIKFDFLGLRNLTIIENALQFVKKKTGTLIDIHNVLLDDKKTFELLSQGKTVGVFQLESRGMRRLAKDLKPNKLSDITAMVALYRPGPMELIPSFLQGKRSPRSIKYLHKDLEPLLAETYGVLVYQEQVMAIAHGIAGYTMSEADGFRMAMGKKKKALMKKEKIKFTEQAEQRGYSKTMIEKLYAAIEKFAAYGFNKPHAASYALIAYWTAYIKANYPIEYMAALLTAELQGSAGAQREAKMFQAIEECKSMELSVMPPDINKSEHDFSIEEGAIRLGMSAIKNVGTAAIDSILSARAEKEFIGLKDFLSRVDTRKANKKTIESLIKAGAFDAFGTRASLLQYYPQALTEAVSRRSQQASGQFGLFGEVKQEFLLDTDMIAIPEHPDNTLLEMEKEVVGFSISRNPLQQYAHIIDTKVQKKLGEITEEDIGKTYIFAGSIGAIKQVTTKKNNDKMAFVTVFDETGSLDLIIFPRLYAVSQSTWRENAVILFKGRVDEKDEGLSVIVEKAVDLEKMSV